MHLKTLLGTTTGICAVVGVFIILAKGPHTPTKTASPKNPPGHLILQVEGDVLAPRITWITAKVSEFNPLRGQDSEFQVVLLDGKGAELGSYPLDLSPFDTDPANIGKPLRVEGCQVRDTNIATIVNAPFFATATSIEVRRGETVLTTLAAGDYARLLGEGDRR